MKVELNVVIVEFEILKEEDRKIVKTVLELIILSSIDDVVRRFVLIRIKKIGRRRKESRTSSTRTKIVKVESRLNRFRN